MSLAKGISLFYIFMVVILFSTCKTKILKNNLLSSVEKKSWEKYSGDFKFSDNINCRLIYISDEHSVRMKIPKNKSYYSMSEKYVPIGLPGEEEHIWKISPSHRYILFVNNFIKIIRARKMESFYQKNAIVGIYNLRKHNVEKVLNFSEKKTKKLYYKEYKNVAWSSDEKRIYFEVIHTYMVPSKKEGLYGFQKRMEKTTLEYVDLKTLKTYKLWESREFDTDPPKYEDTFDFFSMDINNPIGDKLIFYGYDKDIPKRGIYIFDIIKRKMKKFPGIANPVLQPNGKYMNFTGLSKGKCVIGVMDLNNYKIKLFYKNENGDVFPSVWTPDGKFLVVFESDSNGKSYVSVISKAGKFINRIFCFEDHESKPPLFKPSFSRDGRFLLSSFIEYGTHWHTVYDLIIDFKEKKICKLQYPLITTDKFKKLRFIEHPEISKSLKRRYHELQEDEKNDVDKLKFIIRTSKCKMKRKKAIVTLTKFIRVEKNKKKLKRKFKEIFSNGLYYSIKEETKKYFFESLYNINDKHTYELLKEIKDFYDIKDEEINKFKENKCWSEEFPCNVRNVFIKVYKSFRKKYSK